MVKVVTDSSFNAEVLSESSMPVLVDFWAPWCGPCRMVSPVVEQMEKEFSGKIKVCKIDTDENAQSAISYNITGIPCLLIFKNGKEATRLVGYRPADMMKKDIEKVLAQ
jgi:thioredoxin 1